MKYKALAKEKMKNPREAFKNEDGAIDLASIMVGVIVIGLIGGVIAATVFAVIPWTQDNAAKQQLDSVVAAQSAYMGLASSVPPGTPAGHAPNSYADSAKLAEAKLMGTGESYCAVVTGAGAGYAAFSQSDSGKIWAVTDKNTKPAPLEQTSLTLPAECDFIKASASGSSSPSSTTSPSPSASPTPTADPAPVDAHEGIMADSTTYPHHNEDKTVHAGGSDVAVHIGFMTTGAGPNEYDVKFTGGEALNAAATQSTNYISGTQDWYAHIQPKAGGYTVGEGYITATATHKTTGKVLTKHWKLTVTEAPGMADSTAYVHHNGNKTGFSGGSAQKHPFGFMLLNSQSRDYTVTFTGGAAINAAATQTTGFAGQDDWYTHFSAAAGGYTVGTDTITATATNVATGKVYTRTFTLTITQGEGIVNSTGYAHHNTDKTGTSGAGRDRHAFGFLIKDSLAQDYTVKFTGGAAINAAATQATGYVGNGDWYTHLAPAAGGFTVGTDVITATVTNVKTGQVMTKTFNLTITEGPGMVASTAYAHHNTDKVITAGATHAEAFGFRVANADKADYQVTWSGGSEVGVVQPYAVNDFVSNTSDWFIHAKPDASGWKVGESIITATAKNVKTGQTYTKTFKITVNP